MAIRATTPPARRDTDYQAFLTAFPDFVRRISSLRKLRDREFAKLPHLPGRDRHSRARKLLLSRSLHLLYAYEGWRNAGGLRDATPESISALAARCNPFQRCDEPATLLWVRGRARRRLVRSYGPAKRMRQLLVADLLRSLHPPLDNQYMFRGGMPTAFRAVAEAYADGFTYCTEVDFTDFYGSVRLNGLGNLLRPLPPSVVEHVVWDRTVRTVADSDDVASLSWASPSLNGQSGLALGASCSPIVAERIIASLLASDDRCRMVAYADNILVLGRSPEAVDASFRQMQERAAGFADWLLRPRRDSIKLMGDGFDFLHHNASIDDGQFIWAPDHRKVDEFLSAESDDDLTIADIADAEAKISHWRRAYPNWPEGDLMETQQLAALAARRFYKAASPINRSHAAHALIASYFAAGRLRSFDDLAPPGRSSGEDEKRADLIEAAQTRLLLMARRARVGREAVRFLG